MPGAGPGALDGGPGLHCHGHSAGIQHGGGLVHLPLVPLLLSLFSTRGSGGRKNCPASRSTIRWVEGGGREALGRMSSYPPEDARGEAPVQESLRRYGAGIPHILRNKLSSRDKGPTIRVGQYDLLYVSFLFIWFLLKKKCPKVLTQKM